MISFTLRKFLLSLIKLPAHWIIIVYSFVKITLRFLIFIRLWIKSLSSLWRFPTARHWIVPKIIFFFFNQDVFCVSDDICYVWVIDALFDVIFLARIDWSWIVWKRINIPIKLVKFICYASLWIPFNCSFIANFVPPL